MEFSAVFCYCLLWLGVCIWRMFAFVSVVVTVGVCGNVCYVAGFVKDSVVACLGGVKYSVCLCRGV